MVMVKRGIIKKAKTSRLSMPRGRVFQTLEGLESMKRLRALRNMASNIQQLRADKGIE